MRILSAALLVTVAACGSPMPIVDGGPSEDGGRALYLPCERDEECVAGSICATERQDRQAGRYCAPSCVSGTCPSGFTGSCETDESQIEACVITCAGREDCPPNADCHGGRCIPMGLVPYGRCSTTSPVCPPELGCATPPETAPIGLCAPACSRVPGSCGSHGGTCVEPILGGEPVCIIPCVGTATSSDCKIGIDSLWGACIGEGRAPDHCGFVPIL
jgi:hypothetical protein